MEKIGPKSVMKSKGMAWAAMILVVALVVILCVMHTPWWGFIAVFFAFIGVFSHLASLYVAKMSRPAANTLENVAFVCILLGVVGILIEYIVTNWLLDL